MQRSGRLVWVMACLVGLVAIVAFALLRSAQRQGTRNFLLISLDTLRADRLGSYGYAPARTPHLDRLAAEGVRFESAVAQVPLTLPSHTTLFTGTYPSRHGVRDNGGYFLRPELTTLAELAGEQGHRTAAFVSAFVLDSKWGLDRGFETYFDQFDLSRYERVSLGSVERIAEDTVDEFLSWLEENEDTPFFAWVHLFDAHAPYSAPDPFGSQFSDRPYDGEVAYVDAEVGRLLRSLEAHGRDRDTVVVVTGDHGEGLGEHRELTHGNFVYESTLRVPLIMALPGKQHAGLVIDEPVAVMDLFPTLAEMMGAAVPAQNQGESLLPLLSGGELPERALVAETFYPRLHYGWSEVVALRDRRFKFVDTPRAELYDLLEDPGETTNLAEQRTEMVDEMRAALIERTTGEPESWAAPAPVDSETLRRLRALGYVGSAAPVTDVKRADLPDPKDKIELIHAISRADALGAADNNDEAIALLEGVLAQDPQIVDAYLSLGNKLSGVGRHDEAIAAFERCLELNPEYSLALTNLALAYKQTQRFEEATAWFQKVLEQDPHNRQALFNLGEIFLFQKDYEQALEFFSRGLEEEPESPIFLRQTGVAYYYLGNLGPAESRLREAATARDDLDSVHYVLALLYEKLGREVDAEREYLAERELNPDRIPATFNLARLYGQQQRHDEQIALLEELTRAQPEWAAGFFHLAKAYRDLGREELYAKALQAADRGLELDPESEYAPLGFYVRAEMLEHAGRHEEALRAFERGRELEARLRR